MSDIEFKNAVRNFEQDIKLPPEVADLASMQLHALDLATRQKVVKTIEKDSANTIQHFPLMEFDGDGNLKERTEISGHQSARDVFDTRTGHLTTRDEDFSQFTAEGRKIADVHTHTDYSYFPNGTQKSINHATSGGFFNGARVLEKFDEQTQSMVTRDQSEPGWPTEHSTYDRASGTQKTKDLQYPNGDSAHEEFAASNGNKLIANYTYKDFGKEYQILDLQTGKPTYSKMVYDHWWNMFERKPDKWSPGDR